MLAGLLPESGARVLDKIEPYGLIVLVALLFAGTLGAVLIWPLLISEGLIFQLFGINTIRLF